MNHVLSATLELRDKFTSNIKAAGSAFDTFKAKASSAGKSFSTVVSKLDMDAKKIKGMQHSMNSMAMKGVVGIATGSSVAGLLLKKAYGTYVDLNAQLTRNAAITSATGAEQKKMADQARYLGRTTKFTAKEVAEAQMYQAMAGYTTNQLLEATPTLLKLSIASGEDLARTSDMVTDNLSALGLGVKDLGMYSDLLANMANRTNTNVSMLSDVFAKTGAVMRQVGREDVRDMATAFGVLADSGIKGAEAGTAIKAIYGRFAKASDDKKMLELFKKYNVKLYKKGANGKAEWKGLLQIIDEMKPKFEAMDAAEKNYFLTTVGGIHHMDAFGVLLKANKASLDKSKDAAYGSAGALEKFSNTLKGADQYKIDELKSAWEGFLEKLGQGLSPVFIDGMGKLSAYLNELTDSKKLNADNITALFNKIAGGAKIAAGAFLLAHIAFLAWRASMWDATAIAQLGTMAAVGVSLGIYSALDYGDDKKAAALDPKRLKEVEAQKRKYTNPMAVSSSQALYGESAGLKDAVKVNNFLSDQRRSSSLSKEVNAQLSTQAERNAFARKQHELNMNLKVDVGGTVMKEFVDIDKVAKKAGDEVTINLANKLRTSWGLQQ